MQQLEIPLARNTDPITSDMAADDLIKSGRWKSQKTLVYWMLKAFCRDKYNPTSAELAQASALDRYMVARRLPDLEKSGHAHKLGARRCDVTGKKAVTWRAL